MPLCWLSLKILGLTADNIDGWFSRYLTGRSQSVSLDLSDQLPVNIEVPQGSVLGPLLSFVYLTDLPTIVNESRNMDMFVANTEVESTAKPRCSTQLHSKVNSD